MNAARPTLWEPHDLSLERWYASRSRVLSVLSQGRLQMVFQPIVDLRDGEVIGVEALARFVAEPVRSPDQWFQEAWSIGHGERLEMAAFEAALASMGLLDDRVFLAVNASPETLLDEGLPRLLGRHDTSRLVIEVTEHARIVDYTSVRRAVDRLRDSAVRIAIDDWGAGYASLQHVFELEPDILKIDVSLTRDITTDPLRRAATAFLVSLCREADILLVAEGIETQAQLDALRILGVPAGQGFHVAGPAPLPLATTRLW